MPPRSLRAGEYVIPAWMGVGLLANLLCGFVAKADDAIDYVKQVKPILVERCIACHGPLKQSGGLRLDTAALAVQGGESGAAIAPGRDAESLLLQRVAGQEDERMPPEGERLSADQIDLLRKWIAQGAKAPEEQPLADPKEHWSFQKPVRPRLPALKGTNRDRSTNPIDAFITAEHERLGLTPLPHTDKATLLRRVYLDLVGIPPRRDELHAFLSDTRPDAYERVVDQLLSSPHYAQRWAKHWMDIWRYSDWYGSRDLNELRNSRRHIWRWRDWIIDSIAADKGYDRMLMEMLAADELAPGDLDVQRASGYLGRNYYVFNRHVWLQDTMEYTTAGVLGLTFKCARCHDHKYDPISQEEYFRLRAFFEPYNVRTDPIAGQPELLQGNQPAGAPPGAKLKHGYDVVYDANLTAATYLLERGNEKNPVTDRPLSPGLPGVLGASELNIEPIALPVEAFYPDLRWERRQELLASAEKAVHQAESAVKQANEATELAQRKLEDFRRNTTSAAPDAPFLDETFQEQRANVWKIHSGDWQFAEGRLKLTKPDSFCTIATMEEHPRDFHATLKYRTLPGGAVGSVGVFFDLVELKDAQAVYTHVNANSSGVQAFHRQMGQENYPTAGIVKTPLKLSEEITLEIAARSQELKIWLNGELKLTYTMPMPRQSGRFGLWAHEGMVEFTLLKVTPIAPSLEELTAAVEQRQAEATKAKNAVKIAQAEFTSLKARIAAELAKYGAEGIKPNADETQRLAREASRLERIVALAKAEAEVFVANREWEITQRDAKSDDAQAQQRVQSADAKRKAAQTAVDAAKAALAKDEAAYSPLGPVYPAISSGRRLALARWLVDRNNPLTARVAVNHIWKRHFGTALVPSVANFGLNGKPPSHPALLDWLAVEFMDSAWSQRHLHRLIVTSQAYRRASGSNDSREIIARKNAIDADNKYLWRANVRRMESEVVRDSVLALTDSLDCSLSGPELEPTQADTLPRRSLYFRLTPDDQAVILQLFDGAAPAECFERTESIVPQQALALANSPLSLRQSRVIARELSRPAEGSPTISNDDFVRAAFEQVLGRKPSEDEFAKCSDFLSRQAKLLAKPELLKRKALGVANAVPPSMEPTLRARENLVHVLLNHNDFVTVR